MNASPDRITQWLARLQENGYKLTGPRRAVVEVIVSSEHLLSPFDVFAEAKKRYPRLGLVTVYRTLEKLEEMDLVQRVHRPSGCQTFCPAMEGHQHLLICNQCGRVERFSGDKLDPLMSAVGAESGYSVREHWLQLFGICGLCQARE